MKKQHLGLLVGVGAFFGAAIAFLTLHEPTRSKIVKQAKIAHKKTLKTIKENASKIKVD